MKTKIWKVINLKHLKDEFHYAYLNKNEICATDSHVMIVHKTNEIFPEEFVDQIPEGNWLIPYDCLKEMNKKGAEYSIDNKNQRIVISYKDSDKFFNLLNGDNYPKYKEVIPEYTGKDQLNETGLNPKLLDNLKEAIDPDCIGVKLQFTGQDRPILVRGVYPENYNPEKFENYTALIMPMQIDEM